MPYFSSENINKGFSIKTFHPGLFSDELYYKQYKKPRLKSLSSFRTAQETVTRNFLIKCIKITHKKKWTEILRLDALYPIVMRQTASDHIFSPLSHIKKRACMMNYEWPRAYSEVHHIRPKFAGWNLWFFPRFFFSSLTSFTLLGMRNAMIL